MDCKYLTKDFIHTHHDILTSQNNRYLMSHDFPHIDENPAADSIKL